MSCNGCRVLRRGCSESCILRPCLEWIQSPEAQGNATLFVSKFFGRGDLMAFIKAVPENRRAALFQSLLFEACGRIVNPVNGAVGLLTTGNWHVCQAAVETVLASGGLRRMVVGIQPPDSDEGSEEFLKNSFKVRKQYAPELEAKHQSSKTKIAAAAERGGRGRNCPASRHRRVTASFDSGESDVMTCLQSGDSGVEKPSGKEPKLLNLFV